DVQAARFDRIVEHVYRLWRRGTRGGGHRGGRLAQIDLDGLGGGRHRGSRRGRFAWGRRSGGRGRKRGGRLHLAEVVQPVLRLQLKRRVLRYGTRQDRLVRLAGLGIVALVLSQNRQPETRRDRGGRVTPELIDDLPVRRASFVRPVL